MSSSSLPESHELPDIPLSLIIPLWSLWVSWVPIILMSLQSLSEAPESPLVSWFSSCLSESHEFTLISISLQ